MGYCREIHELTNSLKRFYYPFALEEIPENGIYILFEKGEKSYNGLDRIVRVGTHTGDNQLRSRIRQHFVKENKNISIFRRNIGRAILNKNNDNYLKFWDLRTIKRDDKKKYGHLLNLEYEGKIEDEVSKYIRNAFSFVVFEMGNREDRLLFEARLISEVSNCKNCVPSENWLGKYSPKKKIVESGMWLINELYKNNFSDEEFKILNNILK